MRPDEGRARLHRVAVGALLAHKQNRYSLLQIQRARGLFVRQRGGGAAPGCCPAPWWQTVPSSQTPQRQARHAVQERAMLLVFPAGASTALKGLHRLSLHSTQNLCKPRIVCVPCQNGVSRTMSQWSHHMDVPRKWPREVCLFLKSRACVFIASSAAQERTNGCTVLVFNRDSVQAQSCDAYHCQAHGTNVPRACLR